MAGTTIGGKHTAKTIKTRSGHDYYVHIGRLGGSVKTPTGGFGSYNVGPDGLSGRQRARLAGAKGGRVSKRGPKKPDAADDKLLFAQINYDEPLCVTANPRRAVT